MSNKNAVLSDEEITAVWLDCGGSLIGNNYHIFAHALLSRASSSRAEVEIPEGWTFDRLASGAILVRAPSLGFSARVVDVKSRTEGDRILFALADTLLGTEQPGWIAAAEAPKGEKNNAE